MLYNIIDERKLQSNAKADIADFFLGLKENFSDYKKPMFSINPSPVKISNNLEIQYLKAFKIRI